MTIKGELKRLLGVNITGAILGSVIMYFWMQIRTLRGFKPFLILYSLLLLWLIADIIYWIYNGVHQIDINENNFQITRGKRKERIVIEYNQITDINIHKKLSRVSLQILLEKKTMNIPGIFTFYPGKKIWITSDAFDDKEFNKMCILLKNKYNMVIDTLQIK